jgi:hypothetical protein
MRQLADTLVGLVESVVEPDSSLLTITSATIDVPLEGSVMLAHGSPVFHAALPHTRWRSGLLPPVHRAHLEVGNPFIEDEG